MNTTLNYEKLQTKKALENNQTHNWALKVWEEYLNKTVPNKSVQSPTAKEKKK